MSSYLLPDGTVPVLISSDTADGVRAEAAAVLAYLDEHPRVSPERVAEMLFRTRVARRYRALAMVRTREELLDGLRAVVADTPSRVVVTGDGAASARRIGFVFPGQGSQRPGMGRLYYDVSDAYRAAVDACAAIHRERFEHDQPLHYLLGDEGRYQDTVWEVQPALMFHMYGLAAMWRAAGVEPAATVGHSQGELAAGAVSAVMTLRDSVLAVTHRARLVERISPRGYSMAVLGMDREECEALLARHSGWAELSVVNAPHILAISGDRDTIVDMVELATARGQFAREIKVSYPAHTSIVAELREHFMSFLGDEMSGDCFTASEIPCYGATLGAAITPDLTHRDYWYWNLRNRVRFDRAVVAAVTDGVDTLIEVAEHPVLQLALQENLTLVPREKLPLGRDVKVLGTSLRTAEGLAEFTRNLATIAVHDLDYRWDALRTDDGAAPRPPLRDFPHTIMHPRRLWAGPDLPAAEPQPDAAPAPERLVETWIPLDKRSMLAPRTLAVVDHTGRCAELADALVAAADRHGATATVLDAAALAGDLPEFDTAVVLLPELPDTDGAAALDDFAAFFADRAWVPALDRLGPGGQCWLVTTGGESVLADDPVPHLFHGAVAAGYRSAGIERPDILLRHLDLAAGAGPDQAARIVTAVHTAGECELALRGGKLYVKRLVVDPATDASAADTDLSHVLIVGGTGQLGLRFCEHFAHAGAGRVTLVSRSGETERVAGELNRLRRLGRTEIVVEACDVSDAEAVKRFAATIESAPVSLLIHAAVNYVDAELPDITAEMVTEAAGSKVLGLGTVLDIVPFTEQQRILLCSSTAATLSGRGQILYAVTNRMLDILARRLRAQGRDAISIEWGLWSVAGPLDEAGFARVADAGVHPMAPRDAITAGLAGPWGDAMIMSADWAFLREVLDTFGQGSVLPEIATPAAASAPEPDVVEPVVTEQPAAPAAADRPLAERMLTQLHKVMGTDGSESIDGSVPLVALGLDSLQALDFRKRVKAELDRDLPVAAILGGASLDDVVALMAENTN
ncbi:nocobactin polyketide synthase NbtC [Nocardia farcinica]|uniref:nocobactin polyketide synthase NbtC n=1 Tax=Nocardia farcinica TaxID=37329 RepID=UPI002455E400|nr:nocobactin polyketide synthase NbtC [Nocardia farcinica]